VGLKLKEELEITQVDCQPECPKCPEQSLRVPKTFSVQIENLLSECIIRFTDDEYRYVQCVEGIEIGYGSCEQAVELTVCENTSSAQTLACCLPLDFVTLNGDLELLFNISGICDTKCHSEPLILMFHAVYRVPVNELCYYCSGTRPTIDNGDLCNYFDIQIVSVDEQGLITFTVQFLGCPQ
jgi:hypothetical protein